MPTVRTILSLPFFAVGAALAVAGLAAGVADVVRSLETGRVQLATLGDQIYAIAPQTLNLMQAIVQRYLVPQLWDPVIVFVLTLPAWLVLFGLAALTLVVAQLIYGMRRARSAHHRGTP